MSVKPILMNTDMVRAILDGRKTVTRRVVKCSHRDAAGFNIVKNGNGEIVGVMDYDDDERSYEDYTIPPYRPGDILYVRETWSTRKSNECYAQPCHTGICPHKSCELADGSCFPYEYIYKATDSLPAYGGKWRPSIHMPREAARIFLQVTDVRVERLQDSFTKHGGTIFEIRAEGINIPEECRDCIDAYGSPCCIDTTEDDGSECGMLDYPRSDFADLWDSTIKPKDRERYGWVANPWVWVIAFERCAKPKEAIDGSV